MPLPVRQSSEELAQQAVHDLGNLLSVVCLGIAYTRQRDHDEGTRRVLQQADATGAALATLLAVPDIDYGPGVFSRLRMLDEQLTEVLTTPLDPVSKELVESSLVFARRTLRMTRQLRGIARAADPDRYAVDVGSLARRAVSGIRERVAFATCSVTGPSWVQADGTLLEQALRELVANAAECAGDDPVVVVTVEGTLLGLRVTVHDGGQGMDEAVRDRAVEPFFTTRNRPGLGLPLADAVARAHGGALVIDSRPGQGTTATLHIPGPVTPEP